MKLKTLPRLFMISLLALLAVSLTAQENKSKRKSPPVQIQETIEGANILIDYSSPSVRGRTVWGKLVPFGKVWRTGANEATVFETSETIYVNGKMLEAGRYGLFTIPEKTEWTVIFNKDADQWGAYNYDAGKDVLRITATPVKSDTFKEQLTFEIEDSTVNLLWADLIVGFKVTKKGEPAN